MIFSNPKTISLAFGAAALCAMSLPTSAAPTSVAPTRIVALDSQVTDVHYRRPVRHVRNVTVRRHYVGHRHYRRHHNAFPAAAFGLFAGALGAAIASSSYDDGWYGYGYPVSYGYDYGYPYGYGYARPVYNYGYYPRVHHRRFVHRGFTGHRHVIGHRGFVGHRQFVGHRGFVHRGHFAGPRGGFVRAGGPAFGGRGGWGGHRR